MNHAPMAEGLSLAADRNRGAYLIEEVLGGRLSPEEALEQWPKPIDSPAQRLTTAWTNLQHFGDDQDLFAKDAEYAAACRENLARLAAKLRVEAVEFGNEPSDDTDTPLGHVRIANMVLSFLGFVMGYVPLMSAVKTSLHWGFVGLIVCVVLTLLGCCSKRPFLFGALFGVGIHMGLIAWTWYAVALVY